MSPYNNPLFFSAPPIASFTLICYKNRKERMGHWMSLEQDKQSTSSWLERVSGQHNCQVPTRSSEFMLRKYTLPYPPTPPSINNHHTYISYSLIYYVSDLFIFQIFVDDIQYFREGYSGPLNQEVWYLRQDLNPFDIILPERRVHDSGWTELVLVCEIDLVRVWYADGTDSEEKLEVWLVKAVWTWVSLIGIYIETLSCLVAPIYLIANVLDLDMNSDSMRI